MGTLYPGAGFQFILLGVFLIIAILFLLTQQNTLRTIGAGNRLMRPGQVWLQLIPFFGQVWQFFVVGRISRSIRKEMASWDKDSIFGDDALIVEQGVERPTFGIGIAYCTLNVVSIVLNIVNTETAESISLFVGLLALSSTLCWIIYWANLASYKRKLRQKNLATL